jgi:hypothetical protein
MDYADIYYIDPRNADPVRDHRVPGGTQYGGRVPIRPVGGMIPASTGGFPPAAPMGIAPTTYPQPGYSYPPAPMPGYPYPVPPFGTPWGSPAGNISAIVGGFGGLGSLADVIAQIFAAVLPLPSAPTPIGSDVTETNTAGDTNANAKNLITYQSALAGHAKRDEQIRTIGSLLKKLVG